MHDFQPRKKGRKHRKRSQCPDSLVSKALQRSHRYRPSHE